MAGTMRTICSGKVPERARGPNPPEPQHKNKKGSFIQPEQ